MSSTLRDVAQMAGVSSATASRVVNGLENVSEDKKARVMAAISTLQYRPDQNAVQLRRNSARTAGDRASHGVSYKASQAELQTRRSTEKERRKAETLYELRAENLRLRRQISKLRMAAEAWIKDLK